MSAMAFDHLTQSGSASAASIPTAVIVYEDTPTGLRAVHALEWLPLFPATQGNFVRRLWRWDLLRPLWLSEQAACEASAADVLLLSAHGGAEFPPEVQSWLHSWLAHKQSRACAFALLLDHEPTASDGPDRMLVFARHIADCAGVNLFYGFSDTINGRLEPSASPYLLPQPACLSVAHAELRLPELAFTHEPATHT